MKIGTETEYIEIGTAVPQLGQECRSLAVFRRASTAWKRLSVATEFAFLRDLSLAAAWKFIIGRPPLIAVLRATARLRNPLVQGRPSLAGTVIFISNVRTARCIFRLACWRVVTDAHLSLAHGN